MSPKAVPCADCGVQYPYYVMQFDHREGTDKVGIVSKMALRSPIASLKHEMAKCDVVCANCHAERTHRRRREK